MEILSISLKNFKSHSDRAFTFQPGTNAICGENGAGKTSLVEAIAWTLFNHRGAYRTEDFIRNGAASAQVRVSFISNQDGRTYEVSRCTRAGYSIYDPQLGVKLEYTRIEEEVQPWLRQHLGIAPGTDLARLFATTIGIPQGTFTADFLLPTEKRKPIFDAILKVEEYRQANQQMLSLEKYAKAETEKVEAAIAQYEETLQTWEPLQQKQQNLRQEITEHETALQQLHQSLETLQAEKERLAAQAHQVQQLATGLQQRAVQIDSKHQANLRLNQLVERSRQAVKICQANHISYEAFGQAESALKQLDQQRKQRHALWQQQQTQQTALATQQTELTKLRLQLETLSKAEAEIARLQPLIAQQAELEHQQAKIVEQFNQLQALKLERQNLARQLAQLQIELQKQAAAIERTRSLEPDVERIPELEHRRDRLQEQLSRIEAAKQFEADLRQLVAAGVEKCDRHQIQAEAALATLQAVRESVPLLATDSVELVLKTLQAGAELNTELLSALRQILADLSTQTSASMLQQQLQQIKTQLDQTYQYRAELSTLDVKLSQQAQGETEISQLQRQITDLETQLAHEADWQHQRSQLLLRLDQLDNPRSRSQLLARDLQQQAELQANYTHMQQAQGKIQAAIDQLQSQLAPFADLDDQIEQHKQQSQIHQPGYLAYLQHQNDAHQLSQLEAELQIATDELQTLKNEQQIAQTAYERLLQHYDPQQWQQLEADYSATGSQADQIAGGLPQQRKLLEELDSQLAALQAVAEKCDRAQSELKQKEKVRKFITFARKVYKEAGPRITERYVQSISREADKLFRELLNRPSVALEWTRDYEILVQEGAHSRRFINLSGGEQMCAALAVRLALLRVLADVDIAFFDEPTTNMDRVRREQLAEAIANIRSFRQLFVISHDDTFEKVTENLIFVEREP
jgi:exonuclease SbcC